MRSEERLRRASRGWMGLFGIRSRLMCRELILGYAFGWENGRSGSVIHSAPSQLLASFSVFRNRNTKYRFTSPSLGADLTVLVCRVWNGFCTSGRSVIRRADTFRESTISSLRSFKSFSGVTSVSFSSHPPLSLPYDVESSRIVSLSAKQD